MDEQNKSVEEIVDYLSMKYIEHFSFDNAVLMGEIRELKNRRAALKATCLVGIFDSSQFMRDLPVVSDSLKKAAFAYEPNPDDTDEELDRKWGDLYDFYMDVYEHVTTGRYCERFTDPEIGIYDALVGTFQRDFEPKMLAVMHGFSTYLKVYPYKTILTGNPLEPEDRQWEAVLRSLFKKYDTAPMDEEDAFSYIGEVVARLYKEVIDNIEKYYALGIADE